MVVPSFFQVIDNLPETLTSGGIHTRCRLIQKENLGLSIKQRTKSQKTSLSTREFIRKLLVLVFLEL